MKKWRFLYKWKLTCNRVANELVQANQKHIKTEGITSPLQRRQYPIVKSVESCLDAAHAEDSSPEPTITEYFIQNLSNRNRLLRLSFPMIWLLESFPQYLYRLVYDFIIGLINLPDLLHQFPPTLIIFFVHQVENWSLLQENVSQNE